MQSELLRIEISTFEHVICPAIPLLCLAQSMYLLSF